MLDPKFKSVAGCVLAVAIALGCSGVRADDPPEVQIGERMFLETRFAQFFFAHSNGNVNATLADGDPAMQTLQSPRGPIQGPFANQSMNCR